jgi:hypothetical protein
MREIRPVRADKDFAIALIAEILGGALLRADGARRQKGR